MERIKRMIDNQKQISGENSIQIQNKDGNVTIQQGITYTEIEKIFLNLFEANFPKLLSVPVNMKCKKGGCGYFFGLPHPANNPKLFL